MNDHDTKKRSRQRSAGGFSAGILAKSSRVQKPTGKPILGKNRKVKEDFSKLAPPEPQGTGERIAKIMARAGLCSRRDAESWIGAGRVTLNGVALSSAAVNVKPGDDVAVDGKPLIHRARTRLFLFHKPRGLVTTARDPEGRPTVFGYLRQHRPSLPRVISIGRLDINTEGLLLLTNDGGLARILELPSTGWLRRYRVRVNGVTDQALLDTLRDGVTIDGMRYKGITAVLDRVQGANSWLTMTLREGKNREIKRVLKHLGLYVNRLIRLSYGPFQLGEMPEGTVEEISTQVLRDQLGPMLAKQAGADFSSPLEEKNEAEDAIEDLPRSRRTGEDHKTVRRPRPTHSPGAAGGLKKPYRHDHQGSKPTIAPVTAAKVKPLPRARRHVSVLRAAEDEPHGPRRRIEHRETADRAGRTVFVEQLKVANRHKDNQDKRSGKQSGGKSKLPAGRGRGSVEDHNIRTGRAPGSKGERGRNQNPKGGKRPPPHGQGPGRTRGRP